MTLETLTTITLLTELLLALRANDPKGFRTLLEMGLDELGLDVVNELTRDFLVPLLSEAEAVWMVGWNWGVSLGNPVIAELLQPCDKHHSSR